MLRRCRVWEKAGAVVPPIIKCSLRFQYSITSLLCLHKICYHTCLGKYKEKFISVVKFCREVQAETPYKAEWLDKRIFFIKFVILYIKIVLYKIKYYFIYFLFFCLPVSVYFLLYGIFLKGWDLLNFNLKFWIIFLYLFNNLNLLFITVYVDL